MTTSYTLNLEHSSLGMKLWQEFVNDEMYDETFIHWLTHYKAPYILETNILTDGVSVNLIFENDKSLTLFLLQA